MKDKLKKREVVLGTFLSEIAAPNLLRLMKAAGLHYVIVDCEHGYFDYSQVASLAAVANGIGLTALVRIPEISRECVQKYLDAGADGLLAPMVSSAEEAGELVRLAKYAPLGSRGISTMRPHSEYHPGKLTDYTKLANERTILMVQIETREGVKHAGEIAAVEGLDAVLIGPNDLACDYGTTGDFKTPEMKDAIQAVIKAAEAAGKPSGIIASNVSFLKECMADGMTVFSCNSEVGLLMKGIQGMMKEFWWN